MIEKLVIQKLTIAGKKYEYPDTTALVGKINELADAVNKQQDIIRQIGEWGSSKGECLWCENLTKVNLNDRMIGCDTLEIPPTYKTDIQRAAESANKNLDNALTVAVDALKRIGANYPRMTDLYRMKIVNDAIEKIAAILKVRQKD